MDGLQIAGLSGIIREEIKRSDKTGTTEPVLGDASSELRWRLALFEIVVDALKAIHYDTEVFDRSICKEEARFRAAGFLDLALADSFGARPPRNESVDSNSDLLSISKLAHCYLSLRQTRVRGLLECEDTLQDLCIGLAVAYQPVVRNLDLQVSSCKTLLRADRRRSLILFISCVVQGMLGRASKLGSDGCASLKLSATEPSMVHLRVETCDPLAEIYGSSEYHIAIGIAASLRAEFVCRQGPAKGSILEMQFSTEPSDASSRQIERR
jgi:hypothetical protein